jgi:glyoxylase-like metal-dependent hydrolase (beta-lactamase superfamily II)
VEIYCLIVGRAFRHHSFMFHLSPRHDEVELVYPLWAIRRDGRVTLVDTGFGAAVADARAVRDYRDPDALLGAVGIDPRAVETVVVSHLHYDHFGMPERFARARFVVQRADVGYFLGYGADHPATMLTDRASLDALRGLIEAGRVAQLDGDASAAGVRLLHVGGHTPGMQLTLVPRDDGAPVLLACDASHFYANCESSTPTAIIHSYDAYQAGFARIRGEAGARWFPGHDPAMLTRLEPVAERVYRVPI